MSNREAETSRVEPIRNRTSEWIDLSDACVPYEPIHPRARIEYDRHERGETDDKGETTMVL